MKADVTHAVTTIAQVPEAYHDPAWLVQRAWSVLRLPRLQELIRATIADLQSLPPPGQLGRESTSATRPACDPVAEALRACCEELRDASGMPGAEADRADHCRAVRAYMQQEPLAWSETFVEALNGYRRAATRALERAFARAAAA
jgi:hypothetical protein